MVRVGIIGLGFMGRMHYGAYQDVPGCRLWRLPMPTPSGPRAICRTGGERPRPRSETTPDGPHPRHDRLPRADPRTEVDVDRRLPPDACSTWQVATRAIETGKHVSARSPWRAPCADATGSSPPPRRIPEAASSCPRCACDSGASGSGSSRPWTSSGTARCARATFRRAGTMPGRMVPRWQTLGGRALDLHVHDVDFVYHLFGKPRAVFSRGYSKDTANSITSSRNTSTIPPPLSPPRGHGHGRRLRLPMHFNVNFDRATADFEFGREKPCFVHGRECSVDHATHNGYVGEMRYLVDCINKGRPTRVTAEDAVTGLQIIEAERQSSAAGKVVEV